MGRFARVHGFVVRVRMHFRLSVVVSIILRIVLMQVSDGVKVERIPHLPIAMLKVYIGVDLAACR